MSNQSGWTRQWRAKLAPIGVESEDGREVNPEDGWWTIRDERGVPLYLGVGGPVAGRVDQVTIVDGALMAAGVIDPAVSTAGLRPQMQLCQGGSRLHIDGVVLSGGEPTWPDVWIEVSQQ